MDEYKYESESSGLIINERANMSASMNSYHLDCYGNMWKYGLINLFGGVNISIRER